MNERINEVEVVEQDLLMTVDDFSRQEGVTPRTVYRWIELGRLDTVERLGKKYVNASIPLKTAVSDIDKNGHDMKSSSVGALQSVNVFEEYLKTLRENSRRHEKSCRRWQMSCFASVFLFFVALLAGTAISLFYHYGYENLSDKLETSSTELDEVESGRTDALARIDMLNNRMGAKLKPYKDENIRLQKRLDELVARNDDLRDRLDETFDRNAVLLQWFSEQTMIDEVASAEPLETPNDTKP
ncbi:MAG: hypothetical protein B6I25_01095 [Planctomycetales bacterium 4572_13]|nr:MAG: hypothetical protein B6I25_01095 [Planctomycetales bacterium 4572_13]